MTGPRILIIMSYTGGGHRSAALALEEALLHLAPQAEVTVVDIYAHLPFPLSRIDELYGPVVQYSQSLWQLLWDLTQSPEKADRLIRVIAPLAKPTLCELLQEQRPDVVVSVYPLCTHALAQARRELGFYIPQVTVVTDLVNIHPTWGCPQVDRCVVSTESAWQQILTYGVPAERVRLLGLPVKLQFGTCQEEKRALQSRLRLAPDMWTLLLMGGAEGVGPLCEMAWALDESDLPLQLLVVAGRNEKLYHEMAATSWNKDVRLFGFVENVWELMGVSDLLLTKAGPGTICEGLNAGLPILIVDALPGQEAGNADYVVSHGAGLLIGSPGALVSTLQELLESEHGRTDTLHPMQKMKAQAQQLARPQAALDIAQLILEQADSQSLTALTGRGMRH